MLLILLGLGTPRGFPTIATLPPTRAQLVTTLLAPCRGGNCGRGVMPETEEHCPEGSGCHGTGMGPCSSDWVIGLVSDMVLIPEDLPVDI